MHYTLHLFLVLALNYLHFVDSDDKIYGGRLAKDGEFPSAVCMRSGIDVCGGVLLTLDKFVTAAHCIPIKAFYVVTKITVGTVNCKKKGAGGQEAKMKSATVHKDYKKKSPADGGYWHDIAIVEVEKPFTLSDTLKLMEVVSTNPKEFKKSWDDIVAAKTPCTTVGWGKVDEQKMSLENLKATEMVFWTDDKCKANSTPGEDMTEFGEVCSTPFKSTEGFCGSDSGSPLFCGKYAYAITSANYACGTDDPYFHLLFWHYLKFLGLSNDDSGSGSNANSCKHVGILLVTFCFLLLQK